MKLYALRNKNYSSRKNKNYYLGVKIFSNSDAQDCGACSVYFSSEEDNVWVTTSIENARKMLVEITPWFNSDINNPSAGGIDMTSYEVIEFVPSEIDEN